MAEKLTVPEIRRVLVALDFPADSLAVLEAAATLATRPNAELVGVYVEDVSVAHAAALPFSHEISLSTGQRKKFDPETVEREFRRQAAHAERALATVARQRKVRHSFHKARGEMVRELLATAMANDMIVIGKRSQTFSRLGTATRAIAARAAVTCIVSEGRGMPAPHAVAAVYDGSSCADLALSFAAQLAKTDDGGLTLLTVGTKGNDGAALSAKAGAILEGSGISVHCRHLGDRIGHGLETAIENLGCGLLVLGGECPSLPPPALEQLLKRVDCPVLIVRPGN